MPDEARPTTFTNIASLVKALAWPVLIFYIFMRFQGPLSEIVGLLPDLVKHATKVSAGGVTLEIEQKARETGNEALTSALKGLSPEARKLLLQVGDSYWREWSSSRDGYSRSRQRALNELTQRQLVGYRPENHGSFEKWVRTLGTITSSELGEYDTETLKPSRPLSTEEERRLFAQEFLLSPLGKKAYAVILDVVVHS